MPFAAAVSEHPLTAHATGEVIGAVLERIGERPDLAVVFVSPAHAGALEDVLRSVDAILHPLVLAGAAAESVVGPHLEVEGPAAVSLFAARTGPLAGVVLDGASLPPDPGAPAPPGWPGDDLDEPGALLLLADPFTFDTGGFLRWFGARHPGVPVVGALLSAGRGAGGSRQALGTDVRAGGAVGVLFGRGVEAVPIVSPGARPFGRPLVVTRADGDVLVELAGRPALERLATQARRELSPEEIEGLESGGLRIGVVVDERRERFGPGDFVVREVRGAARHAGTLSLDAAVPVGTTVQFHRRDPSHARRELRVLLAGRDADGVLLFGGRDRATRLLGPEGSDAATVAAALGPAPLAGCSTAAEIGPVAGRNFVHRGSASLLLLRDRRPGRQ